MDAKLSIGLSGTGDDGQSILVVQTNAAHGREREFNDWYNNTHLADVLAVPGFKSAQRFMLSPTRRFSDTPDYKYRYLALYEFEGTAREMYDRLTGVMQSSNPLYITPALDADRIAYAYTAITDRVVRPRG